VFGYNSQVLAAGLGFAIFGVGVEVAGNTVSKIIVKWFTGYEIALALGIQVALARIGTAAALSLSLPIARHMGHLSYPILFAAVLLCIGTLSFMVYNVMDRKLDNSMEATGSEDGEDGFHLRDIRLIINNKGFWLIAILCVLFYSGVFPFLKFATKLMIYKYNVDPDLAGNIPALLPFGTILLTPLFGSLYDRLGKGATLMTIGSVMLASVHFLFALPILDEWWFAVFIMLVLGVAFSLVPSAMWPSVPKIVPQSQLGTAYSLIFYIQNIGLMLVPMLIGWVIDKYAKIDLPDGTVTYDYEIPMIIFTSFGVAAILVALLLKVVNKKEGYGLEEPNMK
ncbi:MAG: MFS transporter, partial [Bacteroidales bacterium]